MFVVLDGFEVDVLLRELSFILIEFDQFEEILQLFWLYTSSEFYWRGVSVAMKFSQLANLLTLLLHTYGEISESCATEFQEDCAGKGNLTAGVRIFHLNAARRDVFVCIGVFNQYDQYVFA